MAGISGSWRLGEFIRHRRKTIGMDQMQFAEAAGWSVRTQGRLEAGQRGLRHDADVAHLAALLGVPEVALRRAASEGVDALERWFADEKRDRLIEEDLKEDELARHLVARGVPPDQVARHISQRRRLRFDGPWPLYPVGMLDRPLQSGDPFGARSDPEGVAGPALAVFRSDTVPVPAEDAIAARELLAAIGNLMERLRDYIPAARCTVTLDEGRPMLGIEWYQRHPVRLVEEAPVADLGATADAKAAEALEDAGEADAARTAPQPERSPGTQGRQAS